VSVSKFGVASNIYGSCADEVLPATCALENSIGRCCFDFMIVSFEFITFATYTATFSTLFLSLAVKIKF